MCGKLEHFMGGKLISSCYLPGLLHQLMKKHFSPAPPVIESLEEEESGTQLGFDTLLFPFFCLAAGLLGSGVLSCLERLLNGCKQKRNNPEINVLTAK